MTERDLQLIRNIVKLLSDVPETTAGTNWPAPAEQLIPAALPDFRFSMAEIGTGAADQPEMGMTVEDRQVIELEAQLAQTKLDLAGLQKEHKSLLLQCEGLREESESMRAMFAMTYEFIQQANPAADLAEMVTSLRTLREQFFFPQDKLAALLSGTLFLAQASPDAPDGVATYLIEKFGIPHLVVVTNPFTGIQAAIFNVLTGFALQQIVATRRYINSSELIDEFQQFVQTAFSHLEHPVEACAVIVDGQNRELEFSSTGAALFTRSGGQIDQYTGGSPVGMDRASDKYIIHRLALRPGSSAFFGLPLKPDMLGQWLRGLATGANLAQQLTYFGQEAQPTNSGLVFIGLNF